MRFRGLREEHCLHYIALLCGKTPNFPPEATSFFLKIPRFPKEYGRLFNLGQLQNAESRTKKIYFGLATCEKLLTFVVR